MLNQSIHQHQNMQEQHSYDQYSQPNYDQHPQHNNANNKPVKKNDDGKSYLQIKTHGSKAAFELSPDETKDGWSTIRLEGAAKLNNNTKQYLWQNKITIQITKIELPIVAAVLLGFLPSCEFGNHGITNKGFALINQGKNFFFKIYEPGENKRMYVCPVPLVEANLMGTLALSQHAKNFPMLSSDSALTAIRSLSSQMVNNRVVPLAKEMPRK